MKKDISINSGALPQNMLSLDALYASGGGFNIDWKYAPLLDDLKAEALELKSYTDAHMTENVSVWRDYRDGRINFRTAQDKSRVVRKVIKRSNSWKYPAYTEPFLASNDLFSLDPATADNTGYMQMNTILNYQFTKEMDRVSFIEKYIRITGDDGTAIMKPIWDIVNVAEDKVVDLRDYDLLPTDTVIALNDDSNIATVRSLRKIRNTFDVEFCEIDSVFIDQACKGNIEKANTIVHRFTSTLSDLALDSRYKNLGDISLGELGIIGDESAAVSYISAIASNNKDVPSKEVYVYEYWGKYDVNGDGILENIVISWVGETIIRMEYNPYPLQEMPFIAVKGIDDSDSVWGSTDAELLMDIQDITSAINRGIIDTLGRTSIGQVISTKGAFSVLELDKLQRGESCEIEQGYSVKDALYAVEYPDLPSGAYQYLQSLDSEAEAFTGVIGYGQGINGRTLGDSATAARATSDSVGTRTVSTLRRLGSGLVKLARKAIRLNIEYLDDEEIERITGEKRQFERNQFIPLTYTNIEISTPELNASKSQKINFMFQTVGPNLDNAMKYKLLSKIAMLDGMEDLALDFANYEDPEPTEMDIAIQEAELAKIRAEANEKAARAEYYRAMTKQATSTTDKIDKEFIDDIDGTTHKRELDKIKAAKQLNNSDASMRQPTGINLPRPVGELQ